MIYELTSVIFHRDMLNHEKVWFAFGCTCPIPNEIVSFSTAWISWVNIYDIIPKTWLFNGQLISLQNPSIIPLCLFHRESQIGLLKSPVWRCPKIGVPPNHQFLEDFPLQAIHLGYPIYGTPHACWQTSVFGVDSLILDVHCCIST